MGRPKIKTIDDSQAEPEIKSQKSKIKSDINDNKGSLSPNAESSRVDEVDRTRGDEPQGAVPPQRDAVSEQVSGAADRNKKSQKPGKAKPRSKKYQEISKDLDRSKNYPLNEALELVKKLSYSKFEGSLEAHINTAQTGLRGLVALPYATGRKLRILAFGKNADKSGADIVGDDSIIEEISKGKIDFDLVVTTPEWMSKLAKVARNLGPRGLMPNPKNGTITDDLKKSVESFQAGKTEYKTESKAPVVHITLGKLNQPTGELSANIKTLFQTLGKTRVKKMTLAPTMGPAIKVDPSSI